MRYALLLFTLIAFSKSSFSSTIGDAAGTAAIIGGATGLGYQGYSARIPKELESWVTADSGTASTLSAGCGLLGEIRLLGVNRANIAFIGLQNNSGDTKTIDLQSIRAQFKNGRNRLLKSMITGAFQNNVLELKPGWYWWALFTFPNKKDFKNKDEVEVTIPVFEAATQRNCQIAMSIKRDTSKPHLVKDYTPATTFDFNFDLGASMLKSGRLKELSDSVNFAFAFQMSIFGSLHHGMYFTVLGETSDNPTSNFYSGTSAASITNPSTTANIFSIGYAHRRVIDEEHYLQFSTGPAITTLFVKDGGSRTEFGYYSFFAQASYDIVLKRVHSGFWIGDWGVGLGAYYNYVPNQTDDGLELDGHNLGLLLRLKGGI